MNRMEIGVLKQIILYVNNMQTQVEFYRDILGLSVSYPIKDDYGSEDWVTFSTGSCTLALHSGGQKRIGEDSPKFTFEVTNVETIKSALEARGVRTGQIVEAYPGSYVCSFWDPEANVFFIQSHPH